MQVLSIYRRVGTGGRRCEVMNDNHWSKISKEIRDEGKKVPKVEKDETKCRGIELTADMLEMDTGDGIQDFCRHIARAKDEAIARGIVANGVIIGDKLIYSKICLGDDEIPVIGGLKAVYTDVFPEELEFLVLNGNFPKTKQEELMQLREENEYLRRRIKSIADIFDVTLRQFAEGVKMVDGGEMGE